MEYKTRGYARAAIKEVKVPYRPNLNRVIGRVTSTILLQQIVFHWENNRHRPFYKFRAPCSHDLYVSGDSWTEELGFTPCEFDTAIRTIGTKINAGESKNEAFSGDNINNLVVYWTDSGRVTWYDLNVALFDRMTDPLYDPDANSGNPNYVIEESPITESRNHDLPIPETSDTSEKARSAPEFSENYSVSIYYNDKSLVRAIGKVKTGPWEITCQECGNDVGITELDTPTECLCGMHEYTLLSKKPPARRRRKPESVEVYYAIAKSKGVRYDSQDEGLEEKISSTVTDVSFWRLVVIEYIARWSPLNILQMLEYYEEHRLPGTKKGDEGGGETTHTPPPPEPERNIPELSEEEIAEWTAGYADAAPPVRVRKEER